MSFSRIDWRFKDSDYELKNIIIDEMNKENLKKPIDALRSIVSKHNKNTDRNYKSIIPDRDAGMDLFMDMTAALNKFDKTKDTKYVYEAMEGIKCQILSL